MSHPVKKYTTSGGVTVYLLPVMAFPKHITNCYLVLGDKPTLLDTGSGLKFSNDSLEAAFKEVRETYGESVDLSDLGRVILTHGHIDHFGGLNHVAQRAPGAEICVHELDLSTITHFHERLIVSSRNLRFFLEQCGLSEAEVADYVEKNKWSKNLFQPMAVQTIIEEGDTIGGLFKVYHAPGHCPGQVCLGLHDILFTADHVLERITPNQSPELIIRYNGLGHYYDALRKIRALDGYRVGLGGHEGDITDIPKRIDEIIGFHDRRLERTLEICHAPKTVKQIAGELFPNARDYHVLLALTETGAHIEHLHERGRLAVTNIDEVESERNPALKYQRV